MSITAQLLASVVLLLVAAAPAGAGAPGAEAAGKPGFCPDDGGVTVVVDFTELGGDVVVRCAPGSTGSGIDALVDAGFDVEGTQRWGTAFVCRLEGHPAADLKLDVEDDPGYQEQCVDTPPTSAFWAYSYADDGEDWTYSSQGASNHQAIEGGFEGWRFVLNHGPTEPAVAPTRPDPENEDDPEPPDPPEPPDEPSKPDKPSKPTKPDKPDRPSQEPTEQPTEEPTDEPSTEPIAPRADRPGAREDTPSKPDRPEKPAKPERPTKPANLDPEPAESGTTSQGVDITGDLPTESTASADEDATSPLATLAGVGVLALLGVGAGLTAYRRRSHST
jgi:hypothetical protein